MGVIKADKSIIRKNSTGSEFIHRRINLIEGTNVTLTVADDAVNNETDVTIAAAGGGDHGALTGLADDDHTQYVLLAGRAGGQTIIGGTAAGDDLTLQTSSHGTKGQIFITEDNGIDYGAGADNDVDLATVTVTGAPRIFWDESQDAFSSTKGMEFSGAMKGTTSLTLGAAGGTTGSLLLSGTTSGTVTLTTAAAAGTYTLTLPTDDGTASQALITDGSGVLSWSTVGGGSSVTKAITQTSHGFAVGDIIRLSAASTYTKAQANTAANAEVVGIVSAVADVNNFTVTTEGYITGLTVTAKEIYFLSDATAGLLTSTAPTTIGSISKPVLDTDTTTSGYVQIQRGSVIPATTVSSTNEFRLSLTNNSAYPTADVTAAGTLYLTPIGNVAGITNATGNIALYDGTSVWTVLNSATVSLALTLTDAKPYDVFVYNNSGTPALEVLVWTDGVTRATALVAQNGILVKSGATTRRYVGTLYASATNQTEDSLLKRFVWNMYNQRQRPLRVTDTTNSWTYSTAAYRQSNANAANQVAAVFGLANEMVSLTAVSIAYHSASNPNFATGIGLDQTTVNSAQINAGGTSIVGIYATSTSYYRATPGIGYHYFAWLETIASSTATLTWAGDGGTADGSITTGITGEIWV